MSVLGHQEEEQELSVYEEMGYRASQGQWDDHRARRQLAHFCDPAELERNREAEARRRQQQQGQGARAAAAALGAWMGGGWDVGGWMGGM